MVEAKNTSKYARAGKSNKQYHAREILTGAQTRARNRGKQRNYERANNSCQQRQARSHDRDDAQGKLISISFGFRLPGIRIIARILEISISWSIPRVTRIPGISRIGCITWIAPLRKLRRLRLRRVPLWQITLILWIGRVSRLRLKCPSRIGLQGPAHMLTIHKLRGLKLHATTRKG